MKRNFFRLQGDEKYKPVIGILNWGRPGFLVVSMLIVLPLRSQVPFEQTAPDAYRIVFTDKNYSPFTLEHPEEYLSERALERRVKQGIDINYNDLPVSPAYIDSIRNTGVTIRNISKWFNAVTILTTGEEALNKITNMSFVKQVLKSATGTKTAGILKRTDNKLIVNEKLALDYGPSLWQTEIHHGSVLHNKGYMGQGMHIAVIDNGFYKVNELPAFFDLWSNSQILGIRDFVDGDSDVFEDEMHGMYVLSIIGGYIPGQLAGTATDAKFWLLRTEDEDSEYIIEEDNWIAAVEFADSAGVDIINTSLGYTTFDDPAQDHTYQDMDGNTIRISIAADIAASKGMLLVVSAGNEGDKPWQYISAPADADSILSVGAIDGNTMIAAFSGRGPSSDGRIKPDVVAIGQDTYYAAFNGAVWQGSGTSFSAPVITGLAACLWQANPDATAMEVREAILKSSHKFNSPDILYGYGIPDFHFANLLLGANQGTFEIPEKSVVFPNPFRDEIYILFKAILQSSVHMELIDQSGAVVLSHMYNGYEGQQCIKITRDLHSLNKGIYIMRIVTDAFTDYQKVIKN